MKDKFKIEVTFEVRSGRTFSRRKEFYDNGKLSLDGLFSNGGQWGWNIPAGIVKTYFRNGLLKSEEHYDESGNRDGESKYYNDQGVLIRRVSYAKDRKTHEELYDKSDKKELIQKRAG
jgi:antitoxin component YwqK of YwqJK toxin-antitoxin module